MVRVVQVRVTQNVPSLSKKKKKKATGNSQTSRTITPVAVRHGGGGVFIFCCSFLEVVRNKEFL